VWEGDVEVILPLKASLNQSPFPFSPPSSRKSRWISEESNPLVNMLQAVACLVNRS